MEKKPIQMTIILIQTKITNFTIILHPHLTQNIYNFDSLTQQSSKINNI